jgi:hypothetical protein
VIKALCLQSTEHEIYIGPGFLYSVSNFSPRSFQFFEGKPARERIQGLAWACHFCLALKKPSRYDQSSNDQSPSETDNGNALMDHCLLIIRYDHESLLWQFSHQDPSGRTVMPAAHSKFKRDL